MSARPLLTLLAVCAVGGDDVGLRQLTREGMEAVRKAKGYTAAAAKGRAMDVVCRLLAARPFKSAAGGRANTAVRAAMQRPASAAADACVQAAEQRRLGLAAVDWAAVPFDTSGRVRRRARMWVSLRDTAADDAFLMHCGSLLWPADITDDVADAAVLDFLFPETRAKADKYGGPLGTWLPVGARVEATRDLSFRRGNVRKGVRGVVVQKGQVKVNSSSGELVFRCKRGMVKVLAEGGHGQQWPRGTLLTVGGRRAAATGAAISAQLARGQATAPQDVLRPLCAGDRVTADGAELVVQSTSPLSAVDGTGNASRLDWKTVSQVRASAGGPTCALPSVGGLVWAARNSTGWPRGAVGVIKAELTHVVYAGGGDGLVLPGRAAERAVPKRMNVIAPHQPFLAGIYQRKKKTAAGVLSWVRRAVVHLPGEDRPVLRRSPSGWRVSTRQGTVARARADYASLPSDAGLRWEVTNATSWAPDSLRVVEA
eukprot:TRINITY_DN17170_c0_g1_i5.p1 TRINITY_DN17170_c0_g1~~TRINITY_DN17170_c0_g1_i5.p1  ORF type:complete len:484 (+),score=123.83 TRINITY_DN17170_c0_g1_i5:64-1515(+)